MRSQLTSWIRKLDSFFPEELPSGTSRIGRTCFTAMAVTENYHSMPHTNRDLFNLVISWFLEGKCSLLHVFILNTSSFLKKKRICRTPSWPHNYEPSRSLNMRSGIRRGICISCAQNVFSTSTWDRHPISIGVASTLHHARPRLKTTVGLCLIPS
jgi:hypothetical protein